MLAIAAVVVYFEGKSREQNHKIASMFSIVSTLAEDMNQMKFICGSMMSNGGVGGSGVGGSGGVGMMSNGGVSNGGSGVSNGGLFNCGVTLEENKHEELIEVSDDEDDEDDEDEDEDEDDEDDDDDDDEDEDDEDDNNNDECINDEDEVKVLKISNEPIFEENTHETITELSEDPSAIIVKHIDLEHEEPVDYKKASIQKLKNLVLEKGLAADASKLKKQELLKLLGIE